MKLKTWGLGLLIAGGALGAAMVIAWTALNHHYAADQPPPTPEEAAQSVRAAIAWLEHNEGDVLRDGNVPIWLMIRESARLTHDPYLTALYARFHRDYIERATLTPDRLMLDPDEHALLDYESLSTDPDYMQFIYYGLTCNQAFGATDPVQRGRSAGRCLPPVLATIFQPPCATHQLVGYLFMLQKKCESPVLVKTEITRLQQRIVRELQVDFRVLDPYVQRVLGLYWTGAADQVKPVWLRRVLVAQQSDGGWADQQPIDLGPHGPWLAFGGYDQRFVTLRHVPSSFHMTAQGLYLMSLYLAQHQPGHARTLSPSTSKVH